MPIKPKILMLDESPLSSLVLNSYISAKFSIKVLHYNQYQYTVKDKYNLLIINSNKVEILKKLMAYKLEKDKYNTPVIVISPISHLSVLNFFLEMRVSDIFVKPINLQAFKNKIDFALNHFKIIY